MTRSRGSRFHEAYCALVVVSVLVASPARANEDDKKPNADEVRLELDNTLQELKRLADDYMRKWLNKEKKDPVLREKAKIHASAHQALLSQVEAVRKYEHSERELKGEVAGSYDEDGSASRGTVEGTSTGLSKIQADITVSRGTYPREFESKASVGVQLSDTNFEEDVSSLAFSYDDHPKPWLEVYGFAERTVDSYLHIDQRWEVGGGTYVAFRRGLTERGKKRLNPLCKDQEPGFVGTVVPQCTENVEAIRDRQKLPNDAKVDTSASNPVAVELHGLRCVVDAKGAKTCPTLLVTDGKDGATVAAEVVKDLLFPGDPDEVERAAKALKNLQDLKKKAVQAIKVTEARFEIGLAVSVFSEIERARLRVPFMIPPPVGSPEGTVGQASERSLSLPGEQLFRFTLRPTLRVVPFNRLRLSFLPYFKIPFNFARVDTFEGTESLVPRRDYRIDARSEIEYEVAGSDTGGETFTVAFVYDWRFDNAPPFATSETLVAQGFPADTKGFTAPKYHKTYQLKLKVKWGS